MSNKHLCHAGLFCLKESVYNVLLEAAHTETRELSNHQISECLGLEISYMDKASYALLRGVLDVLRREGRVERVDEGSGKMIWRINEKN